MTSSDTLRIVQISDPHLSHRRPFFHHNWEILVDLLTQESYDLLVCTGDMTIDGAGCEDELAFAAEQFRRIAGEVLFVPGNHDIGNSLPDTRGGESVITAQRRDAYVRHFGADFWMRDAGASWRLLGLNSMLFGSGLPAEKEQERLIRAASACDDGRRLLVFQHKPLYIMSADETKMTQSALYPEHRTTLRTLLAPAGHVVVSSGHIHDYKTDLWETIDQIWAPSTAFVIDRDGLVHPRYGIRRVGYLRHRLDGEHHEHEFVEPDGFINIDIGNWMRAPNGFHARYATESFRGLGWGRRSDVVD
jgi:3',5'-cyclic AMP phosphodiesterase CpdA